LLRSSGICYTEWVSSFRAYRADIHMRLRDFFAVLVCLVPIAALAQRPINPKPSQVPDEAEERGPWTEERLVLPPFPPDSDWIAFRVDGAGDNKFFVAGKSVAIGKDGVVRYAVMIESPAGARNLTYEGMHCATREKKLYAFGRPDRTWSAAREPQWENLEYKSVNGYQKILFSDFFCPAKTGIASAQEGVAALKAGVHPRAQVRLR
jgi:CNP1-like family